MQRCAPEADVRIVDLILAENGGGGLEVEFALRHLRVHRDAACARAVARTIKDRAAQSQDRRRPEYRESTVSTFILPLEGDGRRRLIQTDAETLELALDDFLIVQYVKFKLAISNVQPEDY